MNSVLSDAFCAGDEASAFLCEGGDVVGDMEPPQHLAKGTRPPKVFLLGVVALLSITGLLASSAAVGGQPRATIHKQDSHTDWGLIEETEVGGTSPLAHSWRIDATVPFFLKPGRHIFHLEEGDIKEVPFNTMMASQISAASSSEFGSKVSASVGVSGSYGAFNGAAQASLEAVSSERHKLYRSKNSITFKHRQLSSAVWDPTSYLEPAFKKFLLHAPVEQIHARVGDFFATEIIFGGVFQIETVTTMFEGETETQVEADLQASYSIIAESAEAHFSAGATSTSKSSKHSYRSQVRAFGGDTSIWLGLTGSNSEDIQSAWSRSVTDDNEFPVSYQLVPIWHLLDDDWMDRSKAAELKAFMLKKWKEVDLPEFPAVPLEAWCSLGVIDGTRNTCCPAHCGRCGGYGCDKRPGGAFECCSGHLQSICATRKDTKCRLP